MNAEEYRGSAFVALLMVSSAVMAMGEDRVGPKMTTPMPACAELEKAPATELVGYLEKDRKGLSDGCVEFAIRQLAAVTDQLSTADTERTIGALLTFLDFPGTVTGRPRWYPAKITIVGATNSAVQRLEDAHQDSGPVKQRALDRLIGLIADTAVSGIAADSAAWAVDGITAYPNAPIGALPAVAMLTRAAKASTDTSSSARLSDEARKLAATCTGLALRSQCDAILN